MAKDPICGMQVEETMAVATSVYEGQTYYFCARACKTAFDQEPTKYLGGKGETREGGGVFHGEAGMGKAMGGWWRRVLVGVVALGGIVLVVLGIGGLVALTTVGNVPPERLGRQVGYTTVALAFGLWLLVWCLVAGIVWAGMTSRR